MDRLGHEFLAGSALAADEHGCLTRRHPADQGGHLQHLAAFADDAFDPMALLERFAQLSILGVQAVALADLLDLVQELIEIERFGEIVVGSVFDRRDRGLDAAVSGHDDHRGLGIDAAHRSQQIEAGKLGHLLIRQDQIERLLAKGLQPLLAALGRGRLKTLFSEKAADQLALRRFVIHYQNAEIVGHQLSGPRRGRVI